MMPDADLRPIHPVECGFIPLPRVTAPLTASIQPAKQQPLQLSAEVLALLKIVRDGHTRQVSVPNKRLRFRLVCNPPSSSLLDAVYDPGAGPATHHSRDRSCCLQAKPHPRPLSTILSGLIGFSVLHFTSQTSSTPEIVASDPDSQWTG